MTKDDVMFFNNKIKKLSEENKVLKDLVKDIKEDLDLNFRIKETFKDGIKNEDDVYYSFHLLDLKNRIEEVKV